MKSRVVFIKVHSEFGHEENSRVIDMIKPRSIETTYCRVRRERVHRLEAIPISQSSHLIPQTPAPQPGVSQYRPMRPGHGSQNTTFHRLSSCE